jgi:hypothetical protein
MDIVDGIVSWWANQYGFELQEVKQLDDDTLYFRVRALGAREGQSSSLWQEPSSNTLGDPC